MSAQPPSIVIPSGATAVVVLEQFSHLDWDWLNTFATNVDGFNPIDPGYFGANGGLRQPANTIYTQAHDLLTTQSQYYYATCEMGFLQAFGMTNATLLSAMIATGRLRIVGGGITSPDNLLSNGECFLRNYIVGLQWMHSVSLPWTRCIWLPDDFGHDSQLPATLVAMDALAVGFARCPMASGYQGNMTDVQPQPAAGTILNQAPSANGGCDFFWTAADDSQIFAHWMPYKYSQGYSLYEGGTIEDLFSANQPCSPTPYVHVPVANDFVVPLGGGAPPITVANTLLDDITTFTNDNPTTPAVLSTFDQYAESVLQYLQSTPSLTFYTRSFHGDANNADATTFRSNPYWQGFYASRMNIKVQHQQATRMMLAAETLDALLAYLGQPLATAPDRLLAAWAVLVPSTHHDYITGTAVDEVVAKEQMPWLAAASDLALVLMTDQLAVLANTLVTTNASLVVFNPLGFSVAGTLVEVDPTLAAPLGLSANQTQTAADGNLLVYVNAPSAGYAIFDSSSLPSAPAAATVTTSPDGTSITLANGLVSATIGESANWSLTDVTDVVANVSILSSGNTLTFFNDNNNIYEFGFECNNNAGFTLLTPNITAGEATITESGPLRVTVSATITAAMTINGQDVSESYTLQYSVTAGMPYVEMTLTGQAPSATSMFVNFALTAGMTQIEHGTPMHWDYKTPATFGSCPDWSSVVEPTHDFVVASNASGFVAAVYHQSLHGWSMVGNTLAGAILRNTPSNGCDGRGASGSDNAQHTIMYALRVPTGITDASTGGPLQEARTYNTPLWVTVTQASSNTASLTSQSLASVSAPCMLTSVKRGTYDPTSLFARVYQPSNASANVVVTFACDATNAVTKSAVERTLTNGGPTLTVAENQVEFTTQSAITTIEVPDFAARS